MKRIEQTTLDAMIDCLDAKQNIVVFDEDNNILFDCKVYNTYEMKRELNKYWINDLTFDFTGVRVIVTEKNIRR